jgi:hypothetical protein
MWCVLSFSYLFSFCTVLVLACWGRFLPHALLMKGQQKKSSRFFKVRVKGVPQIALALGVVYLLHCFLSWALVAPPATHDIANGSSQLRRARKSDSNTPPPPSQRDPNRRTVFDFHVMDYKGRLMSLSDYKDSNSVLIIVNVASESSDTDQNYNELNKIYQKYHDHGLEILAFPSNQVKTLHFNTNTPEGLLSSLFLYLLLLLLLLLLLPLGCFPQLISVFHHFSVIAFALIAFHFPWFDYLLYLLNHFSSHLNHIF